jgi:argininosuccinate synthase
MRQRILLAYTGDAATAAGIAWLRDTYAADVITLTLDVGQGADLGEARARALAAGAVRAHVVDARDEFARGYVLPALQSVLAAQRSDADRVADLAAPLVAARLVEIAAIEGATAVAHSLPSPEVLELAVASMAPHLAVIALPPAAAGDLAATAVNLLVRPAVAPARALDVAAMLDVTFDSGTPVAVNGVRFELADLIESVSVIAGRHAIGGAVGGDGALPAPAVAVLGAAYDAMPPAGSGVVHFKLFKGELAVLAVDHQAHSAAEVPPAALLVTHA